MFAEDQETLLVTANPARFADFYQETELKPVFARWEQDLRQLLETVRSAE